MEPSNWGIAGSSCGVVHCHLQHEHNKFSQNTYFVCEIAKILGSRLELTSVGKIPAITQMYMLSILKSNCLSKYLGVLELSELRIIYTCLKIQ